jgi:pilus assembly protein CpaF
MDCKVITFCSPEPATGRRTLARELARALSDNGQSVLVLEQGQGPTPESPEQWVPRLAAVSPLLLRNYLADTQERYARCVLSPWPAEPLFKSMVSILRKAYAWILVVGPRDTSPDHIAVLDASDLLLWVARPSADLPQRWSQWLMQLTAWHLPTAFARIVLNRVQPESASAIPEVPEPLGVLPEEPGGGLAKLEGTRALARLLSERTDIFRIHEKGVPEKAADTRMIEQLKSQVQPQLLQALGSVIENSSSRSDGREAVLAQQTVEACLAAEVQVGGTRQERSELVTRVLEEVLGLGPLEPLLKDPDITEILVNGLGSLFVEKKGKLFPCPTQFGSDSQLRVIIDRIVAPIGRRVDESSPLCDARLADGSRVNIVLPPLALDGAVVTIRKFSAKKLDLEGLMGLGSMSAEMAAFLRRSVLARQNIVVSGGTGSGKTTLLNALSSAIPDDERIVTIEDAAELKLQKPHVVRLESRPANAEGEGCIPIRRLVMNALRMRPDRIVVGECRGGEALDMLQAMNTGHDGSLTTLHANTPRDALGRLETLVLMAGVDLPVKVVREQIRSAVNLIVQQSRLPDGSRKIVSITEVTGMEGDTLMTQELYRYGEGSFQATGIQPTSRGLRGNL